MRVLSLSLVVVAAVSVGAQTPRPARKASAPASPTSGTVPRTPDGHPDLQGTWDFAQLTPFERPSEFAGRDEVSEDEAEQLAQRRVETTHKDKRDGGAAADVERACNDFWWDFGTRVSKQSSLVVDPPDGRVPALLPSAQERIAQRRNRYDNPEERPLAERCILGFNSGPPMVPSAYNNNVQIVQTPRHIAIVNEMIHSARIVDLSGRPHAPAQMRFLTGDSIGRWDGDTLVVDTTNYAKDGVFRGSTMNMHLVERFTRTDADTLRYDFTVDDPETWTRQWSVSILMVRAERPIYEYACHEANYGLEGVLRGARFQERQQTTKQQR